MSNSFPFCSDEFLLENVHTKVDHCERDYCGRVTYQYNLFKFRFSASTHNIQIAN
jgi:hypothetical protein